MPATALHCRICESEHALEAVGTCQRCFGPLDPVYDWDEVEPYLERYIELTGRAITVDDLFWWEVLGNAKWAIGALTQSRRHLSGQERSVELVVLGRLAAEMEYELLDLLARAA